MDGSLHPQRTQHTNNQGHGARPQQPQQPLPQPLQQPSTFSVYSSVRSYDTQPARNRPEGKSGAEIMGVIKSSTSWHQLASAIHQHAMSDAFNTLHGCAALTHLAQLMVRHHAHSMHDTLNKVDIPGHPFKASSAQSLAAQLAGQVWEGQKELRTRQVANATWAVARLVDAKLLSLSTPLLLQPQPGTVGKTQAGFGPRAPVVADLILALAVMAGTGMRWAGLQPQELSSLAYGLALVGWGPQHLLTAPPTAPLRPQAAYTPHQPQLGSESTSSASWQHARPAIGSSHRSGGTGHAGTGNGGGSQWQGTMVTPGSWMRGLLERATQCMPDMSPQSLANTLWALAAWLPAATADIGSSPGRWRAQQAWAAPSPLSASHQALLTALLANLWAITTPQLLAASSQAGRPGAKGSVPVLIWPPGSLAVVAWSLASLGVLPPPFWLSAWFGATFSLLPSLNARDTAHVAWAMERWQTLAAHPLPAPLRSSLVGSVRESYHGAGSHEVLGSAAFASVVPQVWMTRLAGAVAAHLGRAEPPLGSSSSTSPSSPGSDHGPESGPRHVAGPGPMAGAFEVSTLANAALALRLPIPLTTHQVLMDRLLATPTAFNSRDLLDVLALQVAAVQAHSLPASGTIAQRTAPSPASSQPSAARLSAPQTPGHPGVGAAVGGGSLTARPPSLATALDAGPRSAKAADSQPTPPLQRPTAPLTPCIASLGLGTSPREHLPEITGFLMGAARQLVWEVGERLCLGRTRDPRVAHSSVSPPHLSFRSSQTPSVQQQHSQIPTHPQAQAALQTRPPVASAATPQMSAAIRTSPALQLARVRLWTLVSHLPDPGKATTGKAWRAVQAGLSAPPCPPCAPSHLSARPTFRQSSSSSSVCSSSSSSQSSPQACLPQPPQPPLQPSTTPWGGGVIPYTPRQACTLLAAVYRLRYRAPAANLASLVHLACAPMAAGQVQVKNPQSAAPSLTGPEIGLAEAQDADAVVHQAAQAQVKASVHLAHTAQAVGAAARLSLLSLRHRHVLARSPQMIQLWRDIQARSLRVAIALLPSPSAIRPPLRTHLPALTPNPSSSPAPTRAPTPTTHASSKEQSAGSPTALAVEVVGSLVQLLWAMVQMSQPSVSSKAKHIAQPRPRLTLGPHSPGAGPVWEGNQQVWPAATGKGESAPNLTASWSTSDEWPPGIFRLNRQQRMHIARPTARTHPTSCSSSQSPGGGTRGGRASPIPIFSLSQGAKASHQVAPVVDLFSSREQQGATQVGERSSSRLPNSPNHTPRRRPVARPQPDWQWLTPAKKVIRDKRRWYRKRGGKAEMGGKSLLARRWACGVLAVIAPHVASLPPPILMLLLGALLRMPWWVKPDQLLAPLVQSRGLAPQDLLTALTSRLKGVAEVMGSGELSLATRHVVHMAQVIGIPDYSRKSQRHTSRAGSAQQQQQIIQTRWVKSHQPGPGREQLSPVRHALGQLRHTLVNVWEVRAQQSLQKGEGLRMRLLLASLESMAKVTKRRPKVRAWKGPKSPGSRSEK